MTAANTIASLVKPLDIAAVRCKGCIANRSSRPSRAACLRGRRSAHPSRRKNEGQQIALRERFSTKALRKNWVNIDVFVDHNEVVGDSHAMGRTVQGGCLGTETDFSRG